MNFHSKVSRNVTKKTINELFTPYTYKSISKGVYPRGTEIPGDIERKVVLGVSINNPVKDAICPISSFKKGDQIKSLILDSKTFNLNTRSVTKYVIGLSQNNESKPVEIIFEGYGRDIRGTFNNITILENTKLVLCFLEISPRNEENTGYITIHLKTTITTALR